MKIETKFDKGDTGYIISNGKVYVAKIYPQPVEYMVYYNAKEFIDEDGFTDVDYDVGMLVESQIYKTKAEAEQALKRLEGKDE